MRKGSSESFLYCPEGDGRWPGILYLTDSGGIRAANREAAGRLANQGYAVLMPNVFIVPAERRWNHRSDR